MPAEGGRGGESKGSKAEAGLGAHRAAGGPVRMSRKVKAGQILQAFEGRCLDFSFYFMQIDARF